MSSSSKPNEVLVIYAGNNSQSGDISGYECDYHVQSGTITADNGIEESSYYDMLYPCNKQPEQFASSISSTVLTNLAEHFKLLPDGSACTIPDITLPLWVIGISSAPTDNLLSDVECQKLKADGSGASCCVVVHAPMTFWWTDRDYQQSDILGVLSDAFNSPNATAAISSENVTIQYIGAFMDTNSEGNQGSLPPAVSAPDGQNSTQAESKRSPQLSVIGSIAVVAIVLLFLAVAFLVVFRRRKRAKSRDEIDEAFGKSGDTHSDGPTLEVDVLSEGCDYPSNSQNMQHVPYSFEDDVANTPNSYTFDLANSMKLDVIGTYSGLPTCMAVVPPYPMEETSDSEVDSWAQTDGTVGSLEDRLEEITAEI